MSDELDRIIVKSVIYTSGERDLRAPVQRPPDQGKRYMMGDDPRLPRMPDKPTLFDFFKYRFGPANHLLQSARLAQKNGASEKVVLACLICVNDLYACDPRCRWRWRSPRTSWAGPSSSQRKGSALTRVRRRTCGARSCGRRSICRRPAVQKVRRSTTAT